MEDTGRTDTSLRVWGDLRGTISLAVPLCAAYAGNKLMGLVDTAIVGRLSEVDIAGASLGNAIFFLVVIIGSGTLMGLDPLVSQAIGAGDEEAARKHFHNGMKLSLLMFLPLTGLIFAISHWTLTPMGIKPAIQQTTMAYLLGRTPSILFYFLFISMRCYLQSMASARPIVWATVIANVVNIPLSVFLALGDQGLTAVGLPAVGFAGWGVFGAALGTSLVTMVQMSSLWWAIRKLPRPQSETSSSTQSIRDVVQIGYPIALQFLAEGGLFCSVSILMGQFDADLMGGHQVALQIASFTFTICLGLSSATSVRVGHAIGRKDPIGARRAGFTGIALGAMLMSSSAFVIWQGASLLAHLFATPPGVIQAAIGFLGIAAVFQFVDGIQAVASGALRGTGNTRLPFVLNLISHWMIGMPTAIYLAFFTEVGAKGLWWGLTAGLTAGSILLSIGFTQESRRLITAQALTAAASDNPK